MIEVVIEDDRWQPLQIEALAERAAEATLHHLDLAVAAAEVTVLACDDARIAQFNATFRDKPQPTNVLSWPADERAAATDGGDPAPVLPEPDGTLTLGDIAISYDTCAAEAAAADKTMADHVTHLIVHGILHLLGYDHLRDGDATRMEGLETTILCKLGVDDPY